MCVPGTGDSLCYAFIGFDTDKASEDAYFKMNNVLIDDRRIKVRSGSGFKGIIRVVMRMKMSDMLTDDRRIKAR